MKVRSKLILWICIPLVLTYVAMLIWDYRTQRQRSLEEIKQLVLGRTNLTVSILDSRLTQAQQLADSVADALPQRPERLDPGLRMRLMRMLRQSEFVTGIVIALEPQNSTGRRQNIVIRRVAGGPTIEDLPPGANFDAPEFPWYSQTRQSRRSQWFAPSESTGIFKLPTLAYSVPLLADDDCRGVISVHVTPWVFRWSRPQRRGGVLPPRPGELAEVPAPQTQPAQAAGGLFNLYHDNYLVANAKGEIVYHSPEQADLPLTLHDPRFAAVTAPITSALEQASSNRPDIFTARSSKHPVFTFEPDSDYLVSVVPIRSGDFVFLTAFPQKELMGPINRNLAQRAGFLFTGLLALIAIVYFAARRISRPLEDLASATNQVGAGALDIHVPEPRGSDEIASLSRTFNQMITRIRQQVERIREDAQARARVESELRLARQIQNDLLPRPMPADKPQGRFQLRAQNLPANHVAGDFYDFFFDSTGKLTLVIADVAGHGVAAALMMAVTRTLIRNLATTSLTLADIARQTNDALLQNNTSGMFVTMILATYDPLTGELTYVNAGHPIPMILRQDGSALSLEPSTAPLLGADSFPPDSFTQRQVTLDPGDTLLLYTDGIPEARNAETGEMLEVDGLIAAVGSDRSLTLEQIEANIVSAVHRHLDGPLIDDVTLLMLRRI